MDKLDCPCGCGIDFSSGFFGSNLTKDIQSMLDNNDPDWRDEWEVVDDGDGFFSFVKKMREEISRQTSSSGSSTRPKSECMYHTWKEYVGLTERYLFCEKCDKKKEWGT